MNLSVTGRALLGVKSIKIQLRSLANTKILSNLDNGVRKNDLDIVDLSYDLNDKYNSSKALVIAHGLFASKATYRALAKRINDETKQKIYTVDMRNHGNTEPYVDNMTYRDMARDLSYFIEKIVIGKDQCHSVTLMGHSMGGKASMTLALQNPVNVDRLIIADISPNISPSLNAIKAYLEKMETIDFSKLNPKLFYARKEVDQRLCELELLKNDVNQRQYILTRLGERNGKIDWLFNIKAIKEHVHHIMEFEEFNAQFHKPTLFLGGELSNYITEKDVPSIERYFTNFEIKKIPKAGHVIHFDNPTDTIKEINNFINLN